MPEASAANIHTAIIEVMKAAAWARKSGTNDYHKYSYIMEADVLQAVRGPMIEQGLYLSPNLLRSWSDDHGNVYCEVEYTLTHAPTGEKITFKMQGCGNDRAKNGIVGDKGLPKSITSANKYMLLKLYQLAGGDDPEEGSDNDEAQRTQASGPQRQGVRGGSGAGSVAPGGAGLSLNPVAPQGVPAQAGQPLRMGVETRAVGELPSGSLRLDGGPDRPQGGQEGMTHGKETLQAIQPAPGSLASGAQLPHVNQPATGAGARGAALVLQPGPSADVAYPEAVEPEEQGLNLSPEKPPNPIYAHSPDGLPLLRVDNPPDKVWALVEATFLAFLPGIKVEKRLKEFWTENIQVLEEMKLRAPEAYVVVRDAFTRRKGELS